MNEPAWQPSPSPGTASVGKSVILDTNVALALWLFADPRLTALRDALSSRRLVWLVTQPMLDELAHEIKADRCARYGVTVEGVRAAILDLPHRLKETPSAPFRSSATMRCSDPKDQMFIDLAVSEGVHWLLSRDRAVLKLRRKLLAFGVKAQPPEYWESGEHGP